MAQWQADGVKWHWLRALLIWISTTAPSWAQPVFNFQLQDVNPNSARYNSVVGPRDYLHQVSGYYFGNANCTYCRAQFGYLVQIATELKNANSPVNINVIGMNQFGQESGNSQVTSTTTLPWLQQDGTIPTAANRWFAGLRDVHILTPQNTLYTIYNLTDHDLSEPGNYNTLKQLFLTAAQFTDTDSDGLLDDWEILMFGNLSHTGTEDTDNDGQNNAQEFAFGTKPNDATSHTSFQVTFTGSGASRKLSVTFKRRSGSMFSYGIESSSDLASWSSSGVVTVQSFQQLFDGSGTGTTTLTIPAPVGTAKAFVRVRALE